MIKGRELNLKMIEKNMKITILSGSPKGKLSVTLEYWKYIAKKFPENDFIIFHIGQKIKSIETKEKEFNDILQAVEQSDLVAWIFPVYYTLIPSQLKRFIELIFKKNAESIFEGKYTTSFSTSIHFFDTSAHDYLEMICNDLNMQYIGRYSADMYDIFKTGERKQIFNYAEDIFTNILEKRVLLPRFKPLIPITLNYKLSDLNQLEPEKGQHKEEKQPVEQNRIIDQKNIKVLILTDTSPKARSDDDYENADLHNQNIKNMTDKILKEYSGISDPELININQINLKGPCIGCMKCSYDNKCIYEKTKDKFNSFYREKVIKEADIIIIAGKITDRYLSSKWKEFFDRCYFMNHTPVLKDKQIGFIISGPLSQLSYLQEIFRAWVEFQGSNYLGYVTDEWDESSKVDLLLKQMAEKSIKYHKKSYKTPMMFHSESTMRMFRDDVYSRLRFICQADHRHYKENGFYASFPQKDKFAKKMNRKMMFLTKVSKKIRRYVYDNCTLELWKPIHNAAKNKD